MQIIIERAPETSNNFISCPITKLQYNGFNKFVAIWACGHVISRKAFKEVKVEEASSEPKVKEESGSRESSDKQ